MTLGIELRPAAAAAVVIDGDARVVARDAREPAGAEAVRDLVAGFASLHPSRAGIAARYPAAAISPALVAAVTAASGGHRPRVLPTGAAVALAEARIGAARGRQQVAALVIDDGVEAGLALGERLFEGAHGLAGAAAWLSLNPVERDDYRALGCLASEISSGGIVRRLVWRLKAGDESSVLELAGGSPASITIDHIFTAARQRDRVAVSVVRDTVRYLGMAVANVVALVDPDIVVLGGLVSAAADLVVGPVRTEASRRLPQPLGSILCVEPAALGGDGAAIGAALAAASAP